MTEREPSHFLNLYITICTISAKWYDDKVDLSNVIISIYSIMISEY